jgi:hypothetical protein
LLIALLFSGSGVPELFGSGSRLMTFAEAELIRLEGMTLPGNGAPVVGS